jgi:hypothetical protein
MSACTVTWTEIDPRLPVLPHQDHACVFHTTGPHSRHECRCGLNTYEATP